MKTVKTILNRRVAQLQADDQVVVPAWARGRVLSLEKVVQETSKTEAIRVQYAAGGPEPVLYLPTYVLTVERMVPLNQLNPPEEIP